MAVEPLSRWGFLGCLEPSLSRKTCCERFVRRLHSRQGKGGKLRYPLGAEHTSVAEAAVVAFVHTRQEPAASASALLTTGSNS